MLKGCLGKYKEKNARDQEMKDEEVKAPQTIQN